MIRRSEPKRRYFECAENLVYADHHRRQMAQIIQQTHPQKQTLEIEAVEHQFSLLSMWTPFGDNRAEKTSLVPNDPYLGYILLGLLVVGGAVTLILFIVNRRRKNRG